MFFASEADKTPVQQWSSASVTILDSDKPKHIQLEITGANSTTLHFNVGSKDIAEAILAKLRSSKSIGLASEPSPKPSSPSLPLREDSPDSELARSTTPKPKKNANVHWPSSPAEIIRASTPDEEEEEEETHGPGVPGVVLYDFSADAEDELQVTAGEDVTVIDREGSEEWWKCRNARGEEGVVPALYIDVGVLPLGYLVTLTFLWL